MGGLFSMIGMGIDVQGLVVFVGSFVLWVVGFVPGLIGGSLGRKRNPAARGTSRALGKITLVTAVLLWAVCVWDYLRRGSGGGSTQFVTLFALANTCVGLRILFPPGRGPRPDRANRAG